MYKQHEPTIDEVVFDLRTGDSTWEDATFDRLLEALEVLL